MSPDPNLVSLSAQGVALLLDFADSALPRVVHWGLDLGLLAGEEQAVRSALIANRPSGSDGLIPFQGEGWFGCPVLAGHRDGVVRPPRFEVAAAPAACSSARKGSDSGTAWCRASTVPRRVREAVPAGGSLVGTPTRGGGGTLL